MFLEIFTTQVSSVYKRFLLHIGSSALQCTTYYNLFRKSHSRHGPILYSCNTQLAVLPSLLLPLMQIWLFIVPEGPERALGISDWCSFQHEMWASRFLSFWALMGLLWVFRLSGLLGWACVPLDFWTSGFCTSWLLGFRTFEPSHLQSS